MSAVPAPGEGDAARVLFGVDLDDMGAGPPGAKSNLDDDGDGWTCTARDVWRLDRTGEGPSAREKNAYELMMVGVNEITALPVPVQVLVEAAAAGVKVRIAGVDSPGRDARLPLVWPEPAGSGALDEAALDAMEARARNASRSIWAGSWLDGRDGMTVTFPNGLHVVDDEDGEDLTLFLHARGDVPRLVAEVRALRAERTRLWSGSRSALALAERWEGRALRAEGRLAERARAEGGSSQV